MKVLDIHLTEDEESRIKAVAEVILENGMVIHEVRVIESDGVLTINPVNHGEYDDEIITDDLHNELESLVLEQYKKLLSNE